MKVSVIIVSYNQPELLRQALESVQQSRAVYPVETIVIDNGSALSFAAWLRADFPTVRLIENRENLGFSRANNQGAVIAGGEYLLFLNNDARVEPDTIAQMVGRMDEEPQIGVLGPLLLNPDGSFQLSYGRRVSFFSEFDQKYFALARERRRLGQPPRRDLFQPVVWVSGACLLTRRGYFPDGRVFDENMFLYFEDHELCLRLASLGKRIVYWSAPAAFHQGGGSAVRKRLPVMIEYRRSDSICTAGTAGFWTCWR